MRTFVIATLISLGVVAAAPAQTRTDKAVFGDVQKAVNRYVYFSIFDTVSAQVHDGTVTLTGKVTLPFKATDIGARVARVDGVTKVDNQLETLPVSNFDNALRLQIATALYRHPVLQMYALGAVPTIHVIVERGRVTLDGVVMNDMDRLIAGMVARESTAFSVKNALKTDAEMKKLLAAL